MSSNRPNYGMVSRCPRLACDDLEEDCAPVSSFRDNGSGEDIYTRNSMHQSDFRHGHKVKADRSSYQEFQSSEQFSEDYCLTGDSFGSIQKEDILPTNFQNLHISDNHETKKQAGSTQTDINNCPKTQVDETIDSGIESYISSEVSNSVRWQRLFQQDEDGDTILHLAIIHGEEEYAVRMLQVASSEHQLNIQNNQQQTPLHLAVLTHQPQLARQLVASGALLDTRDRCGNTALHLACRDGDLDCVRYLTAPLLLTDYHHPNYTPHQQCVPQDLSIKNYEGETVLHLAACKGHLPVLNHLFNDQYCTADVNMQEGKSGRTVLHQAAETNNYQLVQFLLQQPSLQLEALTYDSRTALCLAIDRKLTQITQLLQSAGADESFIHGGSNFSDPDDDLMDPSYDDFSIAGQPVYS